MKLGNQDVEQFLTTIHRYVQLGVHIKGYYSQKYKRFHREVSEVVEFYVTDDNNNEGVKKALEKFCL